MLKTSKLPKQHLLFKTKMDLQLQQSPLQSNLLSLNRLSKIIPPRRIKLVKLVKLSFLDIMVVMKTMSWRRFLKNSVFKEETQPITRHHNYSWPKTKQRELVKSFLRQLINSLNKRCLHGSINTLKNPGQSTIKIKKVTLDMKKLQSS